MIKEESTNPKKHKKFIIRDKFGVEYLAKKRLINKIEIYIDKIPTVNSFNSAGIFSSLKLRSWITV